MAEQSKPNTFSGGLVTDLDPSFVSKDTYFEGVNIRVRTNGDKSYSIENISGPKRMSGALDTNASTTTSYQIHGAVVLGGSLYVIVKQQVANTPTWKIRKYSINESGLFNFTQLWSGLGLFDDDAGLIEIESVEETENTWRIYCTDGITPLKSINVKDPNLDTSTVSDFLAFKPNLLSGVVLSNYNESGGNLKYGSYSYVYRLGSENQSSYTDWSNISRPINIVKYSLINNNSLGVEGGSSADNSSASLDLSITNLSTQYDKIEIASIYYAEENVPVIKIIEEGVISGSTYNFTHSGFETETLVEGGIAAAIISNDTWSVCKVLAKKDNKLYAGNLKSEILDIDATISSYGKLISYKATGGAGSWESTGNLTGHSSSILNPDRHRVGGTNNHHWDPVEAADKNIYKFINANFGTAASPKFVLGAETDGFSEGDDGFRMTFTIKPYHLDEEFNLTPSGTNPNDQHTTSGNQEDCDKIYQLSSTYNSNDWLGGKPGPHNPKWDYNYRSFKRGECYRFGIVFYDLQGVPGFAHHLGDIKMPDALDSNINVLNANGTGADIHQWGHSTTGTNATWAPFNDNSGATGHNQLIANALIPRLEIRLPNTVTSKISGYKIVRAEVTENDRTIITQGLLSHMVRHQSTQSTNTTLLDKFHSQEVPFGMDRHQGVGNSATPHSSFPWRIKTFTGPDYDDNGWNIESPDVTLGGLSYNLGSGYILRPIYMMQMNRVSSTDATSLVAGYWCKASNDETSEGGMRVHKYKIFQGQIDPSVGAAMRLNYKDEWGNSYFYRQHSQISFSKSVVSGETVSTTDSGLSKTYIHYTGQFSNTDGLNQFITATQSIGGDAIGGIQPQWIPEASRAAWYGGAVPTLMTVATNGLSMASRFQDNSSGSPVIKRWNAIHSNNSISQLDYSDSSYSGEYVPYKWMAEIVRDTSSGFEQYGGSNQSAIENTRFIDCTPFQSLSTNNSILTSVDVTGGDTFLDNYTYKNSWNENPEAAEKTRHYGSVVPLEMKQNTALRQGIYFGSSNEVSVISEDNYLFNTAYNQESSYHSSVVKPTGWVENDIFTTKIAASRTKILGERSDAWTQFPSSDFIELPLENGPVTDLLNYNNQLYAIQRNATALLSVNSRALIQGEGAAADIQIVTGTGTAIERYDYLSNSYGCQYYNSSLISPSGFYFYDEENNELLKSDGKNILPLSTQFNYKNFISEIGGYIGTITTGLGDVKKSLYSAYDPEFRECIFSATGVKGGLPSSLIFSVSDLDGSLISELDFKEKGLTNSLNPRGLINMANRCYFFDCLDDTKMNPYVLNGGVYQNFSVGFTVNDNATINKVFDSSEIICDNNTLFSTNNYESSEGLSYNSDVVRVREGIHRVAIRNTTNSNRLRGNYLKHTISYNQVLDGSNFIDENNDQKFNIFAVNTRYRQSR